MLHYVIEMRRYNVPTTVRERAHNNLNIINKLTITLTHKRHEKYSCADLFAV